MTRLYRHKKGGIYLRLFSGTNSETLKREVVYLHLWPHKVGVWIRDQAMFEEPDRFAPLVRWDFLRKSRPWSK